ncbi:MAG: HAD hydrolase-like protein, partial [Anaerovibrio sp.]|nr:HAD hydrolase-like protein [Anaerovibrio sp.]
MQYKAVIFDLDGTLINSIEDLADSCNEMLMAYDLPVHTVEEYKYFVGNGVPKLVERALTA